MRISNRVEEVLSHAVALDQCGNMRNTIYCVGREVFILNYDHTILLRFGLRQSEKVFHSPVSFKANDYDSNEFYEKDGKIVFVTKIGKYVRRKSCKAADLTPAEVRRLYRSYVRPFDETPEGEQKFTVEVSRDLTNLLDPSLSHVEFSGDSGKPLMIKQRNIYTGTVIEVEEVEEGLLNSPSVLPFPVGPIAVRTNDFNALFSFQPALRMTFLGGKPDTLRLTSLDSRRYNMDAVLACCMYDELLEIKEVKDNGRKEPKVRRGE